MSSHHPQSCHPLLHSGSRRREAVSTRSSRKAVSSTHPGTPGKPRVHGTRARSSPPAGSAVHGSGAHAAGSRAHTTTCHPRLLYTAPGVLFAVRLPGHLKVPVLEHHPAVTASEAANVVLLGRFVLEILALDADPAVVAETPVQPVVIVLAVGAVVQHIEC